MTEFDPPAPQTAEAFMTQPGQGGMDFLPEEAMGEGRTLRADAWRRLRKNKLALAGLVWIVIIILVAVTAGLWVPGWLGDPTFIDTAKVSTQSLNPPSSAHPFGTDTLGRDIASRTIYGARVSLLVGVVAVAIMVFIGLVLIAVLGKGFQNVFIAIGVLGWPSIARVFRSSIFGVKENEYVDAARSMGASTRRILFRHIMPNAISPIIVVATMTVGGAILTEAALSFLGMGVQPPTPSWGGMLSEARSYLFSAPWLMLYPGIAIITTVLAFVLLGDGLRDALDVKMKE